MFADLNPYVWEIAHEYLDFVGQYATNFACIRGHVFKIFHKVFERHTDLREQAAQIKSIDLLRGLFDQVRQVCSSSGDLTPISKSKLEYYMCQVHIRQTQLEAEKNVSEIKKQIEETISNDSSSQSIKRHLDEITKAIDYDATNNQEQENARKLVKLLERKRRKTAKLERKQKYAQETSESEPKRPKYINCSACKNPRSDNCDWQLCRSCCKNKVFSDEVECKGHCLKFRIKN